MDTVTDKRTMRQEFRVKRDHFVGNLSSQDSKLAFSVAPSPLKSYFETGKIVAAYIPIGSEADPQMLIQAATAQDCVIALPHVTSKTSPMRFLCWKPGERLENGPFGLKQPRISADSVKPDIILVPLVAFDRRLHRLGQGAGHYDRALSLLPDAMTIGVAWSIQETIHIPADPWDIPLKAILTEKEWMTS